MTKEEVIKELEEYYHEIDKAISEDEEYIFLDSNTNEKVFKISEFIMFDSSNEMSTKCQYCPIGKFTDIPYETPRKLKKNIGYLAYITEGVKSFFDKTRLSEIVYEVDGVEYRGLFSFIIVFCQNLCYYMYIIKGGFVWHLV